MKHILLAVITCLPILLHGQYVQPFSETRTIIVTGSAEMNVMADEIDLEITLREYGDRPNKVEIDKVEKRFFEIMKENNISGDRITFKNSHYEWYYWWRQRKEVTRNKQFVVKVKALDDLMSLMRDLDYEGVSAITIANATNANLTEYRKQVKVQALQAAKEKATYLLESVGEKVGQLLKVEEVQENNYWRQMETSNVRMDIPSGDNGLDNISLIRLRFEVKAQFAIGMN